MDDELLTEKQINDFLDQVEDLGWAAIVGELTPIIEAAARKGVKAAFAQIGVNTDAFELANEDAIQYAKDRGAEMVGMRWEEGKLIPNDRPTIHGPGPTWAISDTTRDKLRGLAEQAIKDGMTATEFKIAIKECDAFSNYRALMIARTEAALASSFGSLALYKREGMKKKQAITAQDDLVSEDCVANAEQGIIAIDEPFLSGHQAPPFHPNCRCVLQSLPE